MKSFSHVWVGLVGLFSVLLLLASRKGRTSPTNAVEQDNSELRRRLAGGDKDSTMVHPTPTLGLDNRFPTLAETIEMVNLANIIYRFRFYYDGEEVCQKVEDEAAAHGRDLECHWFYHDRELGTQVMIASSVKKDYLAVVFCGTDDLTTFLTDIDIAVQPFGNDYDNTSHLVLPDEAVRIHAGFNRAVFRHDNFGQIFDRVEALRHKYDRLYTTGHSLGAADAILTAVGLARRYEREENLKFPVTSISFGTPQIGNRQWRTYVHELINKPKHLAIWKLVLGRDLVPRLPALFQHVGHTVQMHKANHVDRFTSTAEAYYQHYGDKEKGFAGVPVGWSALPYVWIPGALLTHEITKYADYLHNFPPSIWVVDFVRDDDHKDVVADDDFFDDDFHWVDPPHDFVGSSPQQE